MTLLESATRARLASLKAELARLESLKATLMETNSRYFAEIQTLAESIREYDPEYANQAIQQAELMMGSN